MKKSNIQIFFNLLEIMKQVGSFLTLAYHPFYGLEPHLFFPFIRKLTFFDGRFENYLEMVLKWTTNFEHANTYHIITMSLIRVKLSNYSDNIVTTKRY